MGAQPTKTDARGLAGSDAQCAAHPACHRAGGRVFACGSRGGAACRCEDYLTGFAHTAHGNRGARTRCAAQLRCGGIRTHMSRLLEDLDHGTPVLSVQEGNIGEVRGVFASGETRVPQYLLVYWNDTREETLLDTNEVLTISDEGVKLRSQRKT